MKISCVQLAASDHPKQQNIDHALAMLDQAPESDLIMLPELWPSGFFSFDRYVAESEGLQGHLVQTFRQKAAERGCYLLMGSFVEKRGEDYYNCAVLIDPSGQIAATYRKIHLFGYQSAESEILSPGQEVTVVPTQWGRVGFSTCYDLRFPELYRRMLDQGVQIFLIPSAWPLARLEAWLLFNRVRALENLAYLISCNCAGANQGTVLAGNSMVVNPLGQVLAQAGEEEQILSLEIDPQAVEQTRSEFPAVSDRVFK